MNDTKTPRTDAQATLSCDSGLRSAYVVHVEFARELEREIARLTAERDEARQEVCRRQKRSVVFEEALAEANRREWDCFKEDNHGR